MDDYCRPCEYRGTVSFSNAASCKLIYINGKKEDMFWGFNKDNEKATIIQHPTFVVPNECPYYLEKVISNG